MTWALLPSFWSQWYPFWNSDIPTSQSALKQSYTEKTNGQNNDDKVKKPTLGSYSVNYCKILVYFCITHNKHPEKCCEQNSSRHITQQVCILHVSSGIIRHLVVTFLIAEMLPYQRSTVGQKIPQPNYIKMRMGLGFHLGFLPRKAAVYI